MSDWPRIVYDHLRTLGDVGEVVPTGVHPWLMKEHSLTDEEARAAREVAMDELKRRGVIRRQNVRGTYVEILTDYSEGEVR